MRRIIRALGAAGMLALVGLFGCGKAGKPQAGDTVSPKLDKPIRWAAGQNGQINVRLQAQGKDESSPRALDFFHSANPVANVTFYDGDTLVGTEKVELGHRC